MVYECLHGCYACTFIRGIFVRKMIRQKWFPHFTSMHMVHHVSVQHVIPYYSSHNILLRVRIYKKNTDLSQPKAQVVVKMPRNKVAEMQPYEIIRFKNEVCFYNIISRYFTEQICPQYYIATTNLKDFKQPIIVMQDLFEYNEILDENAKKEHIRIVAFFHANGMRLINENREICRNIFSCLETPNVYQQMQRERMAASIFLTSPNIGLIESSLLLEKITKKIKLVTHPKVTVLTLVHGSCIQRHIFLKRNPNTNTYDRKLLDYQGIKLGSPVIDFGYVLLLNLPPDNDVAIVHRYCTEMLDIYITELQKEYPSVNTALVRQEIINYLFYSYLNLGESKQISNYITLIHVFDQLGCFD